jgi:hypothetical protein
MNILILNHLEKQCGVYQYGKRVGNILEKSTNHKFVYLELDSHKDLDDEIDKYNPQAIIYNWTGGTMTWVTPETVNILRQKNIKQFLLVHNVGYATFFDYYLHQHPYWQFVDDKNFAIPRPLPFYTKKDIKKSNDIIRIGSFGFGLLNKHYNEICRIVNDQFHSENVELRLHLTTGTFAGTNQNIPLVSQLCQQNITNKNISLKITTDFISDKELLDFLAGNDLNIFFYENYHTYNGISSVIDYALAVQKPLAINKSSMYSHLLDATPSICVEDNTLTSIISNGFSPLQEKYDSWTHEKFIHTLETIVENVK